MKTGQSAGGKQTLRLTACACMHLLITGSRLHHVLANAHALAHAHVRVTATRLLLQSESVDELARKFAVQERQAREQAAELERARSDNQKLFSQLEILRGKSRVRAFETFNTEVTHFGI